MLWNDFLTQAKKDLKRARLLHEEQDYGFSAYSCQQGLEKYLKAYLLKYEVLDRPSAISHADMSRLFSIIDKRTREFVNKYGKSRYQIVSGDVMQEAKKKMTDLLETMQPSSRNTDDDRMMIKIQLWKHSLQQPIAKSYESRFEMKKEALAESLKPIGVGFQKYYEREIIPLLAKISKEQKTLAAQKYASGGGHFGKFMGQIIEGVVPELNIGEFTLYMIALLSFIENALRKSGYHSSADIWMERKRIYLLAYPYNFYGSIMKTYPHEDIGRYPTPIDKESSLDLYCKYAENLSNLISSVQMDCVKIENAIYGRWDKA